MPRYWRCDGVTGLPDKSTVKDETWLAESFRRGGAPHVDANDDLYRKICLNRPTPDEHPVCAARRANLSSCAR